MQIEGTGVFKGPMDCFLKTVRNEGFLGLYKGMASPLVGIAAVNSLLFWAYSLGKALQTGSASAIPTLGQVAVAGAGAGAVNSVLASPVELLKVRLQVQYTSATSTAGRTAFRGPAPLARHLVRRFGARGIMWGFWATVAREIPAYTAFYTGFEFAKRAFARRLTGGDADRLGPLPLMASGSVGGVSYWVASYPLDVIKSRVQNGVAPPKGIGYIAATARAIAAEQGLWGFFRGFSPSVLRSIPAAGVTFASYELVMRALNSGGQGRQQ
ncbi:hypothetical protein LPJ61_002494 [Coemansia biformis]|uniref:Mitochondrial carrier n=1 Tax=Coemansia biformis TaxID=1286918 RepID=A0A9W8CZ47_9FUNG|nr:hypothetical protein LPJ61_002494 [Coemansia biformis]